MMRRPAALVALFLLVLSSVPAVAQTGRVTGTVRDSNGQPVRGATVTARNEAAPSASVTAVTDDRGRFSLSGLEPGAWTFAATAPGFITTRGGTEVTRRSNPPMDFRLERAIAAADLLPLGGVDSRQLQIALRAADALEKAGRYDEAIAAYESIQTRIPSLTTINLAIGNIHRMRNDGQKALAAYRALLATDPVNEAARVAISSISLERGDVNAAEEALTLVAGTSFAGRDVLCAVGDVKRAQGKRDEAVAWYQKAASSDPLWARPVLKLAQLSAEQNDIDNAVALMQKVLSLSPDSPEATEAKAFIEQHKQ